MTESERTSIVEADHAHYNYEQTLQCRHNLQANFLVLGRLLKESRDESLWKFLGHDNFESYLGTPELGFKRSTAYGLIRLVELYIDKLNVPADRLVSIGTAKLQKVAGVVERNVGEWLDKAESMSKSDLDEELGRGPDINKSSPKSFSPPSGPRPCCVCGKEGEKHHFPVTRGAGAPEHHWIPLCRECHSAYHQAPKDWTWTYKRQWAKYLYDGRTSE